MGKAEKYLWRRGSGECFLHAGIMTRRLIAVLSPLYAEAGRMIVEGVHEITHGLGEHIAIGCIIQKLAHYTGMEEAKMITLAADYVVPIGCTASICYVICRGVRPERIKMKIKSLCLNLKRERNHV